MKITAYTASRGRFCHSLMPSMTRSVIVLIVCLDTSAPYTSARCALISPWVSPFADREITMSSTPVSRVVPAVAEVVIKLAFQCALDHHFRQLSQQAALAGQPQPAGAGPLGKLAQHLLIARGQLHGSLVIVGRHVSHWCLLHLGGYTVEITVPQAKAAGKLVRAVRRVQAAGGAPCTVVIDRQRAAARRVREIASKLRTRGKLSREESTRVIRRVTGELAGLAEKTAAESAAVLRNGRRALPKALSGRVRGRLRRALDELAVTIERTAKIVAQARTRLAGQTPESATRLVSLHDPDARPIRKGRIDKPVEFGYKAQVTDNDDGIILDYGVEYGAAPDGPQLAPAVERICRRTGRVPRAVTADRGYGQPAVERDLHTLGVRTVAIPRQAKTSPARKTIEHSRGFHRLVKWRTGSEGRISYLKGCYGWDRTRLDGRHGAAIWCGHGVFAHNLARTYMILKLVAGA